MIPGTSTSTSTRVVEAPSMILRVLAYNTWHHMAYITLSSHYKQRVVLQFYHVVCIVSYDVYVYVSYMYRVLQYNVLVPGTRSNPFAFNVYYCMDTMIA